MTTQLIIVPKIENSVKPPATKKEVVEALAIIKLKQITDENESNRAKAAELKAECEVSMRGLISGKINSLLESGEINLGYIRNDAGAARKVIYNSGINLELSDSVIPATLRSKLVKYHEVNKKVRQPYSIPNLPDCRKMVQEMLNGSQNATERVKAMVDSPTVSKALATLLKQLEDTPKNKQAITV